MYFLNEVLSITAQESHAMKALPSARDSPQ